MNDDFQIRKDIDNLIEKYNSLNFNRMNADGMATEEYVNDLVDEKIKEIGNSQVIFHMNGIYLFPKEALACQGRVENAYSLATYPVYRRSNKRANQKQK